MRLLNTCAPRPLAIFGRYEVRPFMPHDAPSLACHGNNAKIHMYMRDQYPHPYRRADARRFIERCRRTHPVLAFAAVHNQDAIGCVVLKPGRDINRIAAEIGYWLGEPFWGRGIMTRAVSAVTEYAFTELRMVRVYARPLAFNAASARVLEKSGFRLEGILHAAATKNGTIVDELMYGKIAPGIMAQGGA